MFKRSIIAMFALLLSFSLTNANAFTSYGAKGCGSLISTVDSTSEKDKYGKDLTEMVVRSWIAGYISAFNMWMGTINKNNNADVIASTDIAGVYMSVLNYCRVNPLQNINDAIDDTINQLDPKQKKKR
jgi:hypothetical protein